MSRVHASRSGDAVGRRLRAVVNRLGAETVLVTPEEPWHQIANYCSSQLTENKSDVDIAANAIWVYIGQLLEVPIVRATSFLSSHEQSTPTTLVTDVAMRLEPVGDEAIGRAVDHVTSAYQALSVAMQPVLPTALRFISTNGSTLAQLESELRAEWATDPKMILLGLALFPRE